MGTEEAPSGFPSSSSPFSFLEEDLQSALASSAAAAAAHSLSSLAALSARSSSSRWAVAARIYTVLAAI